MQKPLAQSLGLQNQSKEGTFWCSGYYGFSVSLTSFFMGNLITKFICNGIGRLAFRNNKS